MFGSIRSSLPVAILKNIQNFSVICLLSEASLVPIFSRNINGFESFNPGLRTWEVFYCKIKSIFRGLR